MTEERAGLKSLSVERCPECGSSSLVHDHTSGEVVCTSCGFVVATKPVDRGPEWRAFTPEQYTKKARVGAPYTFTIHDKGLSTTIDRHDIRGFSSEKRVTLHRLRRWHRRTVIDDDRNLASALSEIHRVADSLNLPKNVLETAAIIYRKVIKKRLVRGRTVRGMAVATIYLACRHCKLLRTFEELSQAACVNKADIVRCYRVLVKNLGYLVPPQKTSKYINRFCNELNLSGKVEKVAYEILNTAKELKITSGKKPKSIAAATCYIASKVFGDYRTQTEIAEVAQLTVVTIRNRYKELMKKLWIAVSL